MADNKAEALKEANSKYQLKVYYSGPTLEESGQSEVVLDNLDYKHRPWLIKFYTKDGVCHQFADTLGVYRKISQDMAAILDAVIVNAKQRQAVDKIVDDMLLNYLGTDVAGERDSILDPCEY
jgi:hypothetical protein